MNSQKDGLVSDPMGLQVEANLQVCQDLHLGKNANTDIMHHRNSSHHCFVVLGLCDFLIC